MKHVTVLLNEAVENLNIKEDGIYVDATLGGGGHSSLILSKLTTGKLICFDQDEFAINQAREKLSKINNNFIIIKSNFVNLKRRLEEYGIIGIDGIIYDLGVSSFQFDDEERGFSYNYDARLDMRMDRTQELSAYEIVNSYSYEQIVEILFRYGEENFARKIASSIISSRPVETTFELVEAIKKALPMKVLMTKGHPAKKTFQALRIAVNDELRVFEKSLYQAIDLLNKQGRVVVISFHSLEDRICKTIFKEKSTINIPKNIPIIVTEKPVLNLISKKPILPSQEEIEANNRAHSAKMRVAEKN